MVAYLVFIGICMIVLTIINALLTNLSIGIIILVVVGSVLIEFAIDGLFAYVSTKFSKKFYDKKLVFYRPAKSTLKLYEKLGIKRWKDKVLELGKLHGFSKSKLVDPKNPKYFKRFILECKIGIMGHLMGMILGFLVIAIFPFKAYLGITIPVAIINLFLNLPSWMILRYNLPKLETALKYTLRLQERVKNTENKGENDA